MHKARSNRRANDAAYAKKRRECRELTPEEVEKRTADNRADKVKRYPYPPVYRYRDSDSQPRQPLCYEMGW